MVEYVNAIRKYKARWVASTFKPTTSRLLLVIAAYLDWEIYCWDIKQAFPNAVIDRDNIYTQLPIGVEEYILNKALKDLNYTKYKNLILAIKQAMKSKEY